MECTVENKKQVKLDMVVNAAIVDMYEDTGKYYQRANFMAARGLKKLYNEALPNIKHKVWLPVNANTHTATLPLDFDYETYIGYVDTRWIKHPIKLNNKLTDTRNIVDVDCVDKCPKCNQDTGICNDLIVTEEINLIVINDTTYEQTIVKKLYPNGDYYLETVTPVLNVDTDGVDYNRTKEFIVNFDLKPCGCLEVDDRNTANLIAHCPEIYCNYFASCDNVCNQSIGGYKIFEESGLIQMDERYPYEKVYVEYNGFITKKNGQYYVPQVAFETLVEWTKWKLIANKRNMLRYEKLDQFNNYIRERGNMERIIGRISLSQIIQAITMLPKFDWEYSQDIYNYNSCFSVAANTSSIAEACANAGISSTNTTTIINRTGFILAVRTGDGAGNPVQGNSTYQNNVLINATDLEYVFLAKQTLTKINGDFTFNSATGTISIAPNEFYDGDTLIIPYNKTS